MKILIISHNPMTTHQNMGKTFLGLFSSFSKEELCQLYVYPSLPDIQKCSSYFRITDKDVLKSYYRFKVNGTEIKDSQIDETKHELFENKQDVALYRNRKNKSPSRMLLRDIMWKCSRWYNKSLVSWIKEQKPTHIFVAPGAAKFLYDIALKISKKFNLPIVTYICDEYYFVKDKKGVLSKIQQRLLKKKIECLMQHTSHIITICDELKECYGKTFKIPAETVMTGSNYEITQVPVFKESVTSITYMGNIRYNRYISLAQIGKAIDELNAEHDTDFHLEIYTAEQDEDILKTFEGIKSIRLCGFISGKEFNEKIHSADILLHTEAFDEISINSVKNSISTKIADSLGSGVCFFAYGPDRVASMRYLIDNKCAIICTDEENLKDALKKVFYDRELRNTTVLSALETARKNHDISVVGEHVYKIFEKVCDESSAS